MGQRRLGAGLAVAVVLAGGLTALGIPGPAIAGPVAGPSSAVDLPSAVTAKIGQHTSWTDTEVNVMREQAGQWAFGAAVAKSPTGDYPDGWLFVAANDGNGWKVAFEGDYAFPELTAAAPEKVVSKQEKEVFASHGPTTQLTNGDYRTGMRLPYAIGQDWRLTGGPHSDERRAIDLAGGDGKVRAARGGTMYTMCSSNRGWLRVAHNRGYMSDYYHLRNNLTGDGRSVSDGTYLGDIGTDVSCGGSATGPHVHFSLRQGGEYIPIQYHDLGKWQMYNGADPYEGYARHGSTRVNAGGTLNNYGALQLDQGIVDTNGGTTLNKRSGPGTGYAVVGEVNDGATVNIVCSDTGTTHTGRSGNPTNLWNKLSDGSWVSDAFTWTGTRDPVSGWC
jgi:LasA protease